MFSIKHITTLGNEAILSAEEVTYTSTCTAGDTEHEPFNGTVFYVPTEPKGADSTILQLHGGTVYVMNRFGATVAKYDLGGWALPIAGGLTAAEAARAA